MEAEREEAARLVAMLDDDRTRVRERTRMNDRLVYRLLGATYLLGFGGQYLVSMFMPSLALPAGIVVALAGSGALFVILSHAYAQVNGLRGKAARRPGLFGAAWLIGLVLTLAATVLVSALLPAIDALRVIYVVSVVLIGLIYAGIGIALGGRTDLRLGCWLIGTGIIAALMPMPVTMLAIAILAGLGFFLAARDGEPSREAPGSDHLNSGYAP